MSAVIMELAESRAGTEMWDVALLPEMDEARLLEAVKERHLRGEIYTYIGDILLAVNPFQDLAIYGTEVSDRYSSQPLMLLPPHLFAVADRAYRALQWGAQNVAMNQCIVISGDSGAGKTESTKLLLRHLVRRSKGNLQLGQQVLQVNPLLEAFGNAQTVMNQNSSRFGKYIQLRFKDGAVRGAKINEYLLEKSRVSHQDDGERNFHVFYYLLYGSSQEEKNIYGLLDPSMYRYIGRACTESAHWNAGYREVCNAMRMVGFQDQEELDLKVVLSGILSLGNIVFEPQDDGGVAVPALAVGWLKAAAGQLGVEEEDLLNCLVCTVSMTRGESIRRLHSKQQAEDSRDSIARVVYARMFGWIVTKVNELLLGDLDMKADMQEIGILDIFGFENFSVNRFEQLCINLANEQLQNFFNHHIFQMEQQHYQEEGIDQETVVFKNNKVILDLFLARPLGILSLLDEQSSFPQASDLSFVEKLTVGCKANPHFERGRGKEPAFLIQHYAGKVQYIATGFLERNRDTLPMSVQSLFINSVTSLLSVLFKASISRTGTLTPLERSKFHVSQEKFPSRKMSVGAQFRQSLSVLMEKMYSSSPHFIRCLKPNFEKKPLVFETDMVLNQLRYNGLMETVRIRRDGFSWRPSFHEFTNRFGILLLRPGVETSRASCLEILHRARLIGWQCGKTRLFFKYWHQDQLTHCLLELTRTAIAFQKCYKALLGRRRYRKLVDALKAEQEKLRIVQRDQEEAAARERAGLQELTTREHTGLQEPAARSIVRPVPIPRKRPPLSEPCAPEDPSSMPPVPRPRSRLIELSPFDNPKPGIARGPRRGTEGEKRMIQRRKTLLWFRETQAPRVLNDGEFPPWLYGMISRREAENLLTEKPLGDFLIRISQNRAGYILSYRGQSHCRHYMIDVQSNGCYVIIGEDTAHASLDGLIQHYQQSGLQPYNETLGEPCVKINKWEPDAEELKILTRTLSLGEENASAPGFGEKMSGPEHSDMETQKKYRRSVAEESRQRPHLYKSIRLAMREIQQASSCFQSSNDTSLVNRD